MTATQPPRKRQRTTKNDKPDGGTCANRGEKQRTSQLLQDDRIAWLVKDDNSNVDIIAGDETLSVRRSVLVKNSEYFRGALGSTCVEGATGVITFTDVDPKYLALFASVAYAHSSLMPVTAPLGAASETDEDVKPRPPFAKNTIREYVEVLRLCDRFLCPQMASTVEKCLLREMHDGHRAMFRHGDAATEVHRAQIEAFADGYEAMQELPSRLADTLTRRLLVLFKASVKYKCWAEMVDGLMDRPRFVAAVSRVLAEQVKELEDQRKLRRREVKF